MKYHTFRVQHFPPTTMLKPEDIQEFASGVRQARKAVKLSQQQLADRIKVSRDVIVRLERGENVGLHNAMAAVEALGFKFALAERGQVVEGSFDEFYKEKFRKPLEAEMRASSDPQATGFVKSADRSRIKVVDWNQAVKIK